MISFIPMIQMKVFKLLKDGFRKDFVHTVESQKFSPTHFTF